MFRPILHLMIHLHHFLMFHDPALPAICTSSDPALPDDPFARF
jgi:hypothetical protein